MSGPIVRKYGFPNFDKIFGERKLEHGVDEPEKEKASKTEDTTGPPKATGDEPQGGKAPAGGK